MLPPGANNLLGEKSPTWRKNWRPPQDNSTIAHIWYIIGSFLKASVFWKSPQRKNLSLNLDEAKCDELRGTQSWERDSLYNEQNVASNHWQLQKLWGHFDTSCSEDLGGGAQGHQSASGLQCSVQNVRVLPVETVTGSPGHLSGVWSQLSGGRACGRWK